MEQDSDGVLAVVRDVASGATETLAGTYLVACDGGRSGIRRALGIEFEGMFAQGHNFAVHFRAPQLLDLLRERLGGPAVQIHTLSSARRPYITVVNGVDEWRLSVYLDEEPDPDDAVAWIREAAGAPIDVEILAAQPWSGHCVVARTYRDRRVFLAGDAAHLLWPKGASAPTPGSVTPWTSAGSSPQHSRDGEARRSWTATNRSGGRSPSATSRKPPATGGPTRGSSPIQCSTAWTRKANGADMRWARRSAGRGARSSAARAYSSATATAAPRSACRTAVRSRPTSRTSTCRRRGPAAAHRVWLPDGSSVLDRFGRGFTLVVSGFADPTPLVRAARRCGVPLTVLRLTDPAAAELYERPLVLVRPDGHVGWRGRQSPADPVAVLDKLRGATFPPPDGKAAGAGRAVSAGVGTHLV